MNNHNAIDYIFKNLKIPPDTYNNSGVNVSELKPEEKDLVKNILKNEFS